MYIISVYFNFVKFVCLDTLEKTVHCHVLIHYMEKDVKGSVTVTKSCVMSLQGVKFGHQVKLAYLKQIKPLFRNSKVRLTICLGITVYRFDICFNRRKYAK